MRAEGIRHSLDSNEGAIGKATEEIAPKVTILCQDRIAAQA